MGGAMFPTGDEDRAPLRPSIPQAYAAAGLNAATAALEAHYYRERTGKGQYVDVSVQACVSWIAQSAPDYWPAFKGILRRGGQSWMIPSQVSEEGLWRKTIWRCKDGYICTYLLAGGAAAPRMNAALADWLREEEGIVIKGWKEFSWDYFDLRRVSQEFIDRIEASLEKFFLHHTATELFEEGQRRGVMIYPVSSVRDLLESPQLKARKFWTKVENPDQNGFIIYPGAWAKMSDVPIGIMRRAPHLGEHDEEVRKELSFSFHKVAEDYQDRSETKLKQPFEGLTVVDFGVGVAVPLMTKYLAEHGATVIKVESTRYPDIMRSVPPYINDKPELEHSAFYARFCPNKLATTLNLSHPKGRELARRLVQKADIVADNYRAGIMKRWGLDYEELVKIKPDIIALSSTNLGQVGPQATVAGYGILLTAYIGFYQLTGWPDRGPDLLLGAYTDYLAPPLSLAAVIAALENRRRTGKGQYIDISQAECGLQALTLAILDYTVNGRNWERIGNRSLHACPHGAFRCKGDDSWCVIAVCSEEDWRNFKAALGNPSWAEASRFATFSQRKENEDGLEKLVEGYTIEHTAQEVMELLQSKSVPAGVVQNSKELFEDPQLGFRQNYKLLEHPVVGSYFSMKEPYLFSQTPSDLRQATACLGQDNEFVWTKIVGISSEEFKRFTVEGVFS
jgi:benzylsuccinate CoA-transferase BbsF subunit